MISDFINKLGWKLVEKYPYKARYIAAPDKHIRFYLKRNGTLPGVFLHKYLEPSSLAHNQPWSWCANLVLSGFLRTKEGYTKRRRGIGSAWVANCKEFVQLIDVGEHAWVLVIAGHEVQGWGYKDSNGYYKAAE